jgi:hypothetical protein
VKVELCKNYLSNRVCPYKQRCKFAHGLEELLQNNELSHNFRTKKCKVFYDKKYCKFGERCNFRHCDQEHSSNNMAAIQAAVKEYPELLVGFRNKSIVTGSKTQCQSSRTPSPNN